MSFPSYSVSTSPRDNPPEKKDDKPKEIDPSSSDSSSYIVVEGNSRSSSSSESSDFVSVRIPTEGSAGSCSAGAATTGLGLNQRLSAGGKNQTSKSCVTSATSEYRMTIHNKDEDHDMELGECDRLLPVEDHDDDDDDDHDNKYIGKSSSQRPYRTLSSRMLSLLSRILNRMETIHIRNNIPLLTGTRQVLSGTYPASESVLLCGIKPPRYLWYSFSGFLCDIVQFCIDAFLYTALHIRNPTICWAASFSLSIIARHSSHRYFVFGTYVGGYWNSLLRMYGGYSITIVVSTLSNLMLSRKLTSVSHYGLWLLTMIWTGVVNYLILKKLWSFDRSGGGGGKIGKRNEDEKR